MAVKEPSQVYTSVNNVSDDEQADPTQRGVIPRGTVTGPPGREFHEWRTVLLVLGVSIYALASFGVLAWALHGPEDGEGRRVLRTGNLKVDQFYSGLALSFLLSPVAIMIRAIANRIALIQPFAIASKKPVTLGALSDLGETGFTAILALFPYSIPSAVVQTILTLTGALFVPIGTLLVTTGQFAWPDTGMAYTGLPQGRGGDSGYLALDMYLNTGHGPGVSTFSGSSGALTSDDKFLAQLIDDLLGTLIDFGGTIPDTGGLLGPSSTANITMEDGLIYDGLLTYTWSANCEAAPEITFEVVDIPNDIYQGLNFTFPDGKTAGTDGLTPTNLPFVSVYASDSVMAANGTIPISPTTYYVLAHGVDDSTSVPEDNSDLVEAGGWWISRVKCTPALDWQISRCMWSNKTLSDCTPTSNTTELDLYGLDALPYYFIGLSYYFTLQWQDGNYAQDVLGEPPLLAALTYDPTSVNSGGEYRAPSLDDYEKWYGMIARAIAAVTTDGFFGVAPVQTTGSPPRPVYILRTHILAVVILLLVLVPLLAVGTLASRVLRRLPVRRMTLLTVAAAVRGPWWEERMGNAGQLSPNRLHDVHKKEKVRYGSIGDDPSKIGLGPENGADRGGLI